jgi:type IV pilus assembly protein PilW
MATHLSRNNKHLRTSNSHVLKNGILKDFISAFARRTAHNTARLSLTLLPSAEFIFKKTHRNESGFSLIELLIAMVIGLFVLAGVVQVTVNSKRSYIDNQEISNIQDNVRYAMDIIAKDFRSAGYRACANKEPNVVNIIATNEKNKVAGAFDVTALSAFDGNDITGQPAGLPTLYNRQQGLPSGAAKPDVITLRTVTNNNELTLSNHNPMSGILSTWQTVSFASGTPFMVTDSSCQNVAILVGEKNLASPTEISISDKNCTKGLNSVTPYTCGASITPDSTAPLSPGSNIFPYAANTYFIALSNTFSNTPALKRRFIQITNGEMSYQIEEIALGVENMQLTYGEDTDRDGKVNSTFKTANAVTQWNNVVAMRIELTLRSYNAVGNSGQADGFIRKNVAATITLRNLGI